MIIKLSQKSIYYPPTGDIIAGLDLGGGSDESVIWFASTPNHKIQGTLHVFSCAVIKPPTRLCSEFFSDCSMVYAPHDANRGGGVATLADALTTWNIPHKVLKRTSDRRKQEKRVVEIVERYVKVYFYEGGCKLPLDKLIYDGRRHPNDVEDAFRTLVIGHFGD